ncbi:MAG: menaquinone biosynthesis protein [Dissulfurispiraceae bacterium]
MITDLKLKIGRIPFANLFPIFYTLEKEFDCSSYEFIYGVPSLLNEMLREGVIDLSPSSSVEYLKNSSLYGFVDGISVSSRGPVGSIFLFSSKPIESLDGSTIYVTSQSATSVALLDIVLKRFLGINYSSSVSQIPATMDADAFLLIGDEALKFGSMFKSRSTELSRFPIMYDLGEIWYEKTGLPFVFALWIVRKELYNKADIRNKLLVQFIADLMAAKKKSLHNLIEIAGHSPMKAYLSEDEIVSYWKMLDYELSVEHKKGLYLFRDYLC